MNFLNKLKQTAKAGLCGLAMVAGFTSLQAQHNHNHNGRTCHVMENLEYRKTVDPKVVQKMAAIEAHTQRVLQTGEAVQARNNIIRIPVVVHVIYSNSNENISDAQIQSQIDVLNEDFRRQQLSPGFNEDSRGADIEIEFVLANRDPNGNSTTGITRKASSRTSWGTNDAMKSSANGGVNAWPTGDYLNMWVCNIGGGILGYAQFPGGSASTDGVVMSPQYFGSSEKGNGFYLSAPFDKGRTTTHEVGHWLNLRHIWGDGACGVDDFVGDTPESDGPNYGCPTGHVSCSSVDMVQNYMDYSDDACMNIFTQGQKSRMRALFTSGGARASLLSSQGYDDGGSTGGGGTAFCSSPITTFPYSEGFESGLGDWTQASGDDLDWTRDANGTPSSGTGPSSAVEGNYYMYVESSSPNYPSKTTVINSPCFDLLGMTSPEFTFQYHMNGSAIGSLFLEVSTDNGQWTPIWSLSGSQGNSWTNAAVDLSAYAGQIVQLRFRGVTGNSWAGDITVDDVRLEETAVGGGGNTGGGSPTCNNIQLTLTLDNYPTETTWSIVDANGATVASGGNYSSANSTEVITECLPDGCYDFIINDSYGDGICCSYGNGSYALVDANGSELVSGGSFGSSETVNFCLGDGANNSCPGIDFGAYTVSTYDDAQDNGTFNTPDANTIELNGNAWKSINYPYTVTSNTVVEFEFRSNNQGEIHGLGFDSDNAISSNRTFKVYGTQNWGLGNYDGDYTSGWVTYTIPVGSFYTGTFNRLFFVCDDDANGSANSQFRNIKIYEGTCGAKAANVDFGKTASIIHYDQGENNFTLNIYPNPARNLINVELDTYDEGVQATILDATGRRVWTSQLNRGTNQINIETLTPGMYNLNVVQPNGEYITKKFVKK